MAAKKKAIYRCGGRVYYAGGDHHWTMCALEKGHMGECKAQCSKKVNGRFMRIGITDEASPMDCVLPVDHDGLCRDKYGNNEFPENSERFTILYRKVLTTYGKNDRVLSLKRVR